MDYKLCKTFLNILRTLDYLRAVNSFLMHYLSMYSNKKAAFFQLSLTAFLKSINVGTHIFPGRIFRQNAQIPLLRHANNKDKSLSFLREKGRAVMAGMSLLRYSFKSKSRGKSKYRGTTASTAPAALYAGTPPAPLRAWPLL